MKKFLVFLVLLIIGSSITYGQQYKSHTVAPGENVYRIAKRYNTTPDAIYSINPAAKDGIKEGQVLAIPVVGEGEYRLHTVVEGDTVYSLSKKYNVTTDLIYKLNPDAVNGIGLGQVLRIEKIEGKKEIKIESPSVDVVNTTDKDENVVLDIIKTIPKEREVIRFITHKVKKKETIQSIAKDYKITAEDVKKHNKKLYSSEEVKKKDKIRIPVFKDELTVGSDPVNTIGGVVNTLSTTNTYVVKPKETKYGIARRHGITIGELEALNPGMEPTLPVGAEIVVPTSVFVEYGDVIESGFELYEIQPKETMFSLVRRLDISSDSLLKMNPYIKSGLKSGMVITIPKQGIADSLSINFSEKKYINLERKLFNFKPKKIAVMLPFDLDTLDLDQRKETEKYLKKKKTLRIALDFYNGMLIAVDSAKSKGITTELSVYDTQKNNNAIHVKRLINQNNFDEMDAVIGPLFQANVEAVAAELKKYETPVFSPMSKKESKLYSNFFQTRPTDAMLQDKLISYIEKDSLVKNIVLIVQQGKKYENVKNKLIAKFPNAKIAKIEKGNYLYELNLNKVLEKDKPNWVVFESADVAMISNVTPMLNAKAQSYDITLFTTDKNDAFDDDGVKNEHLSKLHLHYPSINKELDSQNEDELGPFVVRYKKEYGVMPNKFIVRGFDIAYDILMRLGTADDLYHAASVEGTTEYIENKFNYAKKSFGGYYNKAVYLIRFDEDLKLTVVE